MRRTRMDLSSFSGVLSRLRNTDQSCSSGKRCRGVGRIARGDLRSVDVPDNVAAGGHPRVKDYTIRQLLLYAQRCVTWCVAWRVACSVDKLDGALQLTVETSLGNEVGETHGVCLKSR